MTIDSQRQKLSAYALCVAFASKLSICARVRSNSFVGARRVAIDLKKKTSVVHRCVCVQLCVVV